MRNYLKNCLYICCVLVFSYCNREVNDNINYSVSAPNADSTKNMDRRLIGLFKLYVPATLLPMTSSDVIIKYPGSNRPQIVYANEDKSVNLCYSYSNRTLKNQQLESYSVSFKELVERDR
jgi:hypothetical protein